MTFARPIFLASVVILPLVWWLAARTSRRIPHRRLVLRTGAAGCLIAAAAGVAIAVGGAPSTVVVALDRSASIALSAQRDEERAVNAFRSTMQRGDRLAVVAFGAEPVLVQAAADRTHTVAIAPLAGADGTNIAAALRLARASLPATGARRIVLVSDGRETAGRAEREALQTAAAGIPIDILPTSAGPSGTAVRITGIAAPPEVAADEPFTIAVQVAGAPGERATVTAYRGDETLQSQTIDVGGDGHGMASFGDRQHDAGSYLYRAAIGEADEDSAPNGTVVTVSGASRVLYVSRATPMLVRPLEASGFEVQRAAPANVPVDDAALAGYTAVVLDDVAADELPAAALEAMRRFVERRGGGLLLLGNARTLTADGFPAGALAPVLPLDLRPRSGSRAPGLALVVVFDKSGSMAEMADGVSKIEVARQAVMRVLDVLPSSDALGVIAFDSSVVPVTRLAAGVDPAALAAQLNAVAPGGATAIAPAVDRAVEWLRSDAGRDAARRQILLLSDGRAAAADATRLRAIARSAGVQLSVTAIGRDANRPLLEDLATASGGQAYFPSDLRELPRLVAREAARSAGGRIVTEPFTPHGLPHAALAGVDPGGLPAMGGYVVGAARPAAAVLIASHLDDPILSAWNAGLGRVAVFTGDLGSTWSASWRAWEGSSRLWTQVVRWLAATAGERDWQTTLVESERGPRIRLDATAADGSPLDLADVQAVIRVPDGDSRDVSFEPEAPGIYEAALPDGSAGRYEIALTAHDTRTGSEQRVVRTLFWTAASERTTGVDLGALMRLARATGGTRLEGNASPFSAPRQAGFVDLSSAAAAAGLVLYLLDLVVGRGDLLTRLRQRLMPAAAKRVDRAAA